jgi:hypothetical protein
MGALTDDPTSSSALPIETRFALEDRVAGGAWGDVLSATDRTTGERVAVKRLRTRGDDATPAERFHREARLLAQVRHDNVVRYVAYGSDAAGTPCLVLEWLEGEDLRARLSRGALDDAQRIEVVKQAAAGLEALHERGIVHRDMKPSNLFLVPNGDAFTVKVLDLGVARSPTEATLTTAGFAVGTPFYMSPEQARGDDHVTPASDVFSLGVLLHELFTGVRPFTGDDVFAVLAKIVLTDAPRLSLVAPFVPPQLDAIVARALAKDPSARFQTAGALAAALATVPAFQRGAIAARDRTTSPPTLTETAVAAERRVITAAFVKLADGRAVASARESFARVVEQHGGEAHALRDGYLVAVFGSRASRGDEAARGAKAALALRAVLPLARIAVATGRATAVGNDGDASSGVWEARAVSGEVIERGARDVERTNTEGAGAPPVWIDDATARLLGEDLHVEGGALYGARVDTARPLLGRVAPMLGRDRELSLLEGLYDAAVAEPTARAAVVVAPPGAGKSRLRRELLARLATRSPAPVVWVGYGDALAQGSPFALLGGALARALGVRDATSDEARRDALLMALARLLRAQDDSSSDRASAEDLAPAIGEIVGVRFDAPPVDAQLAFDRMQRAWQTLVAVVTSRGPLVLILEDAQWGDVSSMKLVDGALRTLSDQPFFVIVVARPEIDRAFPSLFADRDVTALRLAPLGKRAATELCRLSLGARADEATIARLVTRADGNAFFLEELIRVVDAGETGANAELPDTVLGTVQARLDALGPSGKRVLKAASVLGEVFWRGALETMLAARPGALDGDLVRLEEKEIIERRPSSAFHGERELAFRHALVREGAYALLTDLDRASLHRSAGAWLEAVGDRDAARLAEHHDRGGARERAATFYARAAEQALRGNDFARAIDLGERALASTLGPRHAGLVRLTLSEAHRWRGELEPAAADAAAATELLSSGTTEYFHAVREAIAANGRLGRFDRVASWARTASDALPDPDARGAQIAALVPAAVHTAYSGRHDEALVLAARVDELAAAAGDLSPAVQARIHQLRGVLASQREDLAMASREQRAALAAFRASGDERNAALTESNLGFVLGQIGDLRAAAEALERALATARRMGLGTIAPLAMHNLGLVLAYDGALAQGFAIERQAVETFERLGDPRLVVASRTYLGIIHFLAGDVEGADREALAASSNEGASEATRMGAFALLARIRVRQGKAEEALALADRAMTGLAQGVEELAALARLARVEALEAAGQQEAARVAVREAARLLRERAARLGHDLAPGFLALPDHARTFEIERSLGA